MQKAKKISILNTLNRLINICNNIAEICNKIANIKINNTLLNCVRSTFIRVRVVENTEIIA